MNVLARCVSRSLPVLGLLATSGSGLHAATNTVAPASESGPAILAVADYPYPYTGLKVELDPKQYTEYTYRIEPSNRSDPNVVVLDLLWKPVKKDLMIPFSPRRYQHFILEMALRDADGKMSRVISHEFNVELPPWHEEAKPVQFTVKATETKCVHSQDLRWMQNIKTVIAFTLKIDKVPDGLDTKRFPGFSATAPRIKYRWKDTEQFADGTGSGSTTDLASPLRFGANYQLGKQPYPSCEQIAPSLAVADWSTSTIRLIDKYEFPITNSTGKVE